MKMKQKREPGVELSFSIMTLHVFTLFVFVVARPIFSLLADHSGYLIAINMSALDIYVAIALILVGIPLILVGLVAITGIFGKKFRLLAQAFVCAGFVSVFVLHLMGEVKTVPAIGAWQLPAIVFVAFTILYYRKP